MLKINFYPESDLNPEFAKAAKEYQDIWDKDGERTVEAIERVSGLEFGETEINVFIFHGISRSYPMMLRESYPHYVKKGTIVHELCHRVLSYEASHNKDFDREYGHPVENHKILNLILYDIWLALYGEEFANKQAEWEKNLADAYKKSWEWALSMTKDEREEEFKKVLGRK